ncbi:hypothetical protein [Streptomyces sp. NPDC049906]|uniref:hypothetical protein n=1 Tax=Streptomyces sp. NPDC049906 TaxID=3155656 RepID=UPI00341DFEE0
MAFPPRRVRLRLAALVAAPLLALPVACGAEARESATDDIPSLPAAPSASKSGPDRAGGSPRPEGKSAFYDAQVAYVRCMRAEGGYPDFPDPRLSGHLDWDRIEEIGAQPGRNEGIKGGKDGRCVDELRAALNAQPEIDQQKAYESMLAHAQCMRDNGVSRFTNPVMSNGNAIPGGDPNPASPVLDSGSPAYRQADKACASKLLDGLDGMQ